MAVKQRLLGVKRVICVGSGKGGVGKSLVCAVASLLLHQRGKRVGLLDLDFYGPSVHVIFGAKNVTPVEDRGVAPPEVHGVKVMSIIPYIGESPSALRGSDVTQAFIELLAITRWGELDFLLVDMPPGTGDEVLDVVRVIPRAEFLVVSTPSKLSLPTVRRLLLLLKEIGAPVVGVLANMSKKGDSPVEEFCREGGFRFIGSLPYDLEVEKAIGKPELLLKTEFAKALEAVIEKL